MNEQDTVVKPPSDIYIMKLDFINSRSFIRKKVVNGRAHCDKCGNVFPEVLPVFVIADNDSEELLCYPCDYKRRGINIQDVYNAKRPKGALIQSMKEQKMEQSKVYAIARQILSELTPFCQRAYIAGSLRRMKPDPKDIEIVCEPLTVVAPDGFFEMRKERTMDFVRKVKGIGSIIKGNPLDGRYINIQLGDDLKLDLFIPQEEDFIRQYVIRSGSASFIKNTIASGWRRLGWCGTEDGLRLMTECQKKGADKWVCISRNPTLPPVWKTEEEFFQWIGVEFVKPENRN